MSQLFRLFTLLLGFQIVVEVRGTMRTVDGNTKEKEVSIHINDYPDPYSIPLIQNPNVRTKPVNRPRKDDDCSDEILRKVMNEHITDGGMSESKRAIHAAARRDFEGSWSVICAPCAFSYLAHAQEHCIHSRYGITCLLYRDR
ncbi:unnamed protein product [Caenorhabditis sp. 36 PRJEB53466]|nr:unnamed protein product [Caenorhabditis sp. 36 PRJEB53466]